MDNTQNFIDLVKKRNIEVDESQFNQFCKDVKNAFQRSLKENDDSYLQNYYDKFPLKEDRKINHHLLGKIVKSHCLLLDAF